MEARRIDRARRGELRLRLPREEQTLLRELAHDLQAQLEDEAGDPSLRRLFPPAYDDDEDERGYRDLMGSELLNGRREALKVLEGTVSQRRLTAAEADAWLRALNDLRLVLGTRMDVQEDTLLGELDPLDPRSQGLALYAYLSWLQEQLVEALAE